MEIVKALKVPTGELLVVRGSKGFLETISVGDYGQQVNLNPARPVEDGTPIVPLAEKWVISVSTQYGCSMDCEFCDVPKVGPGRNATLQDMQWQILSALLRPASPRASKRTKVHFVRMGEPSWNMRVIDCAQWLLVLKDKFNPHPVVSTMMPKYNPELKSFIQNWMKLKNTLYGGHAGLQLSINSTDEAERRRMFSNNACSLEKIAEIVNEEAPVARKIVLNFAVAQYRVDPDVLLKLFDPGRYLVKLTPIHETRATLRAGICTSGELTGPEPYQQLASRLREAGYDVLVAVSSREEDFSRITCGNAILSGLLPETYEDVTPDPSRYGN